MVSENQALRQNNPETRDQTGSQIASGQRRLLLTYRCRT